MQCISCPLADKEQQVLDLATGEMRSPRSSSVYEGQVSVTGCTCASTFYHNPDQLCQDIGMECSAVLVAFGL